MAVPKRKTSKARRDSRRSSTGSCPSQELSNARNAMPANLPTGYAKAADIMAESVSSTLIKMKRRQMLKAFPVHF